jgi:hypothetical protein
MFKVYTWPMNNSFWHETTTLLSDSTDILTWFQSHTANTNKTYVRFKVLTGQTVIDPSAVTMSIVEHTNAHPQQWKYNWVVSTDGSTLTYYVPSDSGTIHAPHDVLRLRNAHSADGSVAPSCLSLSFTIGDVTSSAFIQNTNNVPNPDGNFSIGDLNIITNLEIDDQENMTSTVFGITPTLTLTPTLTPTV